jgi:hypothetical protein
MPQLQKSLTELTETSKYYNTFTLPHSTEDASKPNAAHEPETLDTRFLFTPKQILTILSRLHRGKAPGLQCNSLDIYIKRARRIDLKTPEGERKAKALANFFSHIANGEVPSKFEHFLHQTYLVALEKCPKDKKKLRPLEVPPITAITVLSEYAPVFGEYLLPFNFAIGVSGSCDVIICTLQLAIDKYFKLREQRRLLPSRVLVSLDIKNKFNVVS